MNIAIIPARGGSKGIPRKNLLPWADSTLLGNTIRAALRSEIFDVVIVSTEDDEIAQEAIRCGANVSLRPRNLATDSAEVDPVLLWTLEHSEDSFQLSKAKVCALLYATAPLRTDTHIKEAYEVFSLGGYDSLLSVYRDSSYLWRKTGENIVPVNYDPRQRAARQEENWNQWVENKAIYFFEVDGFRDSKCRIFGHTGCYEMSKYNSLDIDLPEDYAAAQLLYRR